MTNNTISVPELIERLRDSGFHQRTHELDAADALEAAQARIAELEADRDQWQAAFGHVLSAIPIPDLIRASGSVRDLIDYLKEALEGR